MDLREHILSEILRLAAANGGKSPGRESFAAATGITATKWTGVYWARWGDALAEAGLDPNALQQRYDSHSLLDKIADFCIRLGRLPTHAEMKLERRRDKDFPSHSTISNHFPTNATLRKALIGISHEPRFFDLESIIGLADETLPSATEQTIDGWVYLLKSGAFYKIGRSANLEARIKGITVALPEAATLFHSIRTDDPPGIEAYWHRRFANKRANGEWFRLTATDVKAFCKRTFQ